MLCSVKAFNTLIFAYILKRDKNKQEVICKNFLFVRVFDCMFKLKLHPRSESSYWLFSSQIPVILSSREETCHCQNGKEGEREARSASPQCATRREMDGIEVVLVGELMAQALAQEMSVAVWCR